MSVPLMPVGTRASLSFHCPHCGRELFVPLEAAGVEGPCPSCGSVVQSPVPGQPAASPAEPAPSVTPRESRSSNRGALVDGYVDHGQVEKRENVNLLRMVFATLLVAALCTVVLLVLRSRFSG